MTKTRNSAYLAAIAERVLIYDGAMGTSIDSYDLDGRGFRRRAVPTAIATTWPGTRPDVIEQIHASFMEAGADVLETNTFQSTRLRLEEWGLADAHPRAQRTCRATCARGRRRVRRPRRPAALCRRLDRPDRQAALVRRPDAVGYQFDELSDTFREQAAALIEGGADVLLVETSVDILEVKAALDGIRRAKRGARSTGCRRAGAGLPRCPTGTMLLGTEIPAVIATLEAMPVDVIGPELLDRAGAHARRDSRTCTSIRACRSRASPTPACRSRSTARRSTRWSRSPSPRILGEYVGEYGVAVVGGCCGTRPDAHRRPCATTIGYDRAPTPREIEYIPSVSSGMRAVALQQDGTLMMIGERVNTLGSRKVKRLLLDDDYDGVMEVAREQVESGAHVLDVLRGDDRARPTSSSR